MLASFVLSNVTIVKMVAANSGISHLFKHLSCMLTLIRLIGFVKHLCNFFSPRFLIFVKSSFLSCNQIVLYNYPVYVYITNRICDISHLVFKSMSHSKRKFIFPHAHICILYLLYTRECFTGNYTTRKIHTKLHPGP